MHQAEEVIDPVNERLGLVSRVLYGTSLGAIGLCIALWIRAKTVGEDERGNAERRALFVGLWPPMFWLIGDTLRREDQRRSGHGIRRRLR
jgi:hypothetical protein